MISGPRVMFEARLRERGYTLDEVRPCIVSDDGDTLTVDETHDAYPRAVRPGYRPPAWTPIPGLATSAGPGTELHSILKDWLGIEPTADCPCRSMAAKMDRLGPDWCESDGMPEILGVMRGEHAKRWADGRTLLPWSDITARQLVLLACRRARAKASA